MLVELFNLVFWLFKTPYSVVVGVKNIQWGLFPLAAAIIISCHCNSYVWGRCTSIVVGTEGDGAGFIYDVTPLGYIVLGGEEGVVCFAELGG